MIYGHCLFAYSFLLLPQTRKYTDIVCLHTLSYSSNKQGNIQTLSDYLLLLILPTNKMIYRHCLFAYSFLLLQPKENKMIYGPCLFTYSFLLLQPKENKVKYGQCLFAYSFLFLKPKVASLYKQGNILTLFVCILLPPKKYKQGYCMYYFDIIHAKKLNLFET